MSSKSRIPFWAAVLIIAVLAHWGWRIGDAAPGWLDGHRDISVFVVAMERMQAGGDDLYAPAEDQGYTTAEFVYPPTSATVMALFYVKDRNWSVKMWSGVMGACIAVSMFMLWLLPMSERRRWKCVALGFGILAAPMWFNIWWGQASVFLMMLAIVGVLLIASGRNMRGGAVLALATHFKVIPGVLLIVLLLQRRFRAAIAMSVGLVIFTLLPLVYTIPAHGPAGGVVKAFDLHVEFIQQRILPTAATQQADVAGSGHPTNLSLADAGERALVSVIKLGGGYDELPADRYVMPRRIARNAGLGLAIQLIAISLLVALRRGPPPVRIGAAGMALLATLISNPVCWIHHLCLLPLFYVPVYWVSCGSRPRMRVFAGITICLLAAMSVVWLWSEGYMQEFTMTLMQWGIPTALIVIAFVLGFLLLMGYEPDQETSTLPPDKTT